MSGGSMNYLSDKIEYELRFREDTPLRRAFMAHMQKVMAALHAIEWNDSGDGHDGEDALVRACLGPHAELEQLVIEARAARDALEAAIITKEGR